MDALDTDRCSLLPPVLDNVLCCCGRSHPTSGCPVWSVDQSNPLAVFFPYVVDGRQVNIGIEYEPFDPAEPVVNHPLGYHPGTVEPKLLVIHFLR